MRTITKHSVMRCKMHVVPKTKKVSKFKDYDAYD